MQLPFTPILLASIFLSSLVVPPIPLSGSFSIRLDDILVLVLIPLTLYFRPRIKPFSLLVLFFVLIVSTVVSTLQSYAFLEVPPSRRDLFEIIRISKPLLILIIIPYVNLEAFSRFIVVAMKTGAAFVILIGFIQFFNIAGLGSVFGNLYSTERHTEALVDSSVRRVFLTGSDPNTGAMIALFFLSFYLSSITRRFQAVKAIKLFLLTVVVLMTSSRTAFLAMAFIVLWLLVTQRKSLTVRILVFFGVLSVVGVLLPYFKYLVIGLTMALEGQNSSLNKRIEVWRESLQLFSRAPLFGWGPAKASQSTIVDGEYILLLRRYGVIGFFLAFVFMAATPARNLFKLVRGDQYQGDYEVLVQTAVLSSLGAMILMITNNVISGYQLMVPLVIFQGLAWRLLSEDAKVSMRDRLNAR